MLRHRNRANLGHVIDLARGLRDEGHPIPREPERGPDEIRASALHPTPKSPLPTTEEVAWFREVTSAYLMHRATDNSRGFSSE